MKLYSSKSLVLIVLCLLSAAVNLGASCTPASTNLVAWWPGEGNANDIAGTNNGTLVNDVAFTNGMVGQAFFFNGSSYVTVPAAPSLSGLSNRITIEAWIKVNEFNTYPDWNAIVTKGNSSWRLARYGGYSTIGFSTTGLSPENLAGNKNINDGQWHHVAGVYDGTNTYIYVDGALDASAAVTGTIAQNNYPVCIGENGEALGHLWNGWIDEPSVYNRALSSNEIAAIYAAGTSGKCPLPPTPPIILVQPTNRTVAESGTAIFSVTAGGTEPLSYQWNFHGTNIDGATNTTLVLTNVQFSQAGNYSMLVTNSYGSTNSATAVLTVLAPPAITVQPVSQTVLAGSNVTFAVTATGAAPLSYQWYFGSTALADGGRISGSATNLLTISNLLGSDAGNYSVLVTNLVGSATSTGAVLTVLSPPVIQTQPVGRSVVLGQAASFSAVASGVTSYQWQLNNVDIPGATNSTYAISAAGTNDFGVYHLVASNSLGIAVSADAVLTWGQIAAWGRNNHGQTVVPPHLTNVVMIAGGGNGDTYAHSLALRADGTVVAWGNNTYGQTDVPESATNVVAVAAGSANSLALRGNGTVVCWGLIPTFPSTLSNVVAIAAGAQHNLALRSDGKVVAWGANTYGQTNVPINLVKVVAIGPGTFHSFAICSDGTLVAWGNNNYGQTNVPLNATNVIAVAGGIQSSLALRADGTVLSWGTNSPVTSLTNVIAGLTNATGIGAGDSYYVALRANGTVLAWGDNNYGQTNTPAYVSNAVAVAGGGSHVLALLNDGRPLITRSPVGGTTWTGRDFTLQATAAGAAPLNCRWQFNGVDIPDATNTTLALSNLALTNAGNYQLIVSNALGVAASIPAPLTVLSNNTLSFWSLPMGQTNYQGNKIQTGASVLGNGPLRYQWYFSATNTGYAPAAGMTNDTLNLDPALAVHSGNYYLAVSNPVAGIISAPVNIKVQFARAWGFQAVSNPPVNVTNAIAVATGGNNYSGHYFALGADGKLTSWANYYASYGETNVSALSNSFVTAIAAGSQFSLALRSDGTVYAWGYGYYGQTNVPSGLNNVIAIACADYHDLALKSDGTIIAWGQNNYGEATNSLAATNAAVAIAAGTYHNLGLRADGTVFGWGYNNYGQTTIPTAATNVIAIAAGQYHSLALRANGTVIGWGDSSNGKTIIPTGVSNIVAISASSTHSTLLRNDGTVVALGYEYTGYASNMIPADVANVIAISSGGDHDFGLLGTRAPYFTIQPVSRTAFKGTTNVLLAAKVAGVQPVTYQWRYNGANIAGATNDALTLTNIQFAQAGSYQLIASNACGVVASKAAKLVVTVPLGEALNATNRAWTTSGNAPWFGQTNVTHDGVAAARSGDIANGQETILQTILATNGPGRCSFWWKVSSEDYFDVLEFRVNGVTQASISGEVDWQSNSIAIPTGTNTLQWRYSKDASYGSGLDAAWVDQFSFIADPPVITVQPVSRTVNMGSTVLFNVTVTGATPWTYLWRQNGTNTVGGSSTLTLTGVGRSRNGSYAVTVSNPGGSTLSSNATLKVLVPQKLGVPVLLPDGTLQLSSGDADGGLLSASDLANFDAWASTNLTDWAILPGALSLTNGTLMLQDGGTTNRPYRFYRITEKP
jgi:alpha-tubulin suppressor-like RCC1 family protein